MFFLLFANIFRKLPTSHPSVVVLVLAFVSMSLLFANNSFRLVFLEYLDGHLDQRSSNDNLELIDDDECEKASIRSNYSKGETFKVIGIKFDFERWRLSVSSELKLSWFYHLYYLIIFTVTLF